MWITELQSIIIEWSSMKSTKLLHFKTFYLYIQYHTELESLVNLLVKLIDSASKVVKLTVIDNDIV